MTGQSLARIDHRGLQMHWLTQAILRDRLTPAQAGATRASEDTLARRRVLGQDHPDTLTTASKLAASLPTPGKADPDS